MSRMLRCTLSLAAAALAITAAAPLAAQHGEECLDPNGPYGLPGVSGPPEEIGEWSAPTPLPIQATHATMLRTGNVLMFREGETLGTPTTTYEWDPALEAITHTAITPSSDIFCSGHVTLPDGRVYVAGGTTVGGLSWGPDATNLYDPIAGTWTRVADMYSGRYYPTATVLGDGRVLVTEGSTVPDDGADPEPYATTPEIYDPVTDTYEALPGADIGLEGYYPNMFQMPSGDVFLAGPRRGTRMLDIDAQTWTFVDQANFGSGAGSAAMLAPGRILKIGGSSTGSELPTDQAETIDFSEAFPEWQLVASMTYPRRRADLVLLPDGTALVVGGGIATNIGQVESECAVHAPELYDPDTDTWTQMQSHQISRQYHSTSLLLPDGRVLAAGGEHAGTPAGETNYEIFSPPYLFRGARPTVTEAPVGASYGSQFQVLTPQPNRIAEINLIRPGSVTHNWDEDQRLVPLQFNRVQNRLIVEAPADGNDAPPGWYMLFLVDDDGAPSVAHFIEIGATCVPTADSEGACANSVDDDCDGLTDLADLDCDPPVPFQPAGAVPDGTSGGPILMGYDRDDGAVTMTWDASCNAADSDYAVYEGDIGAWGELRPVFCSTAGATSKSFDRTGDLFFLVVPHNGVREGSYGFGAGGERQPAAAACLPQDPATCF